MEEKVEYLKSLYEKIKSQDEFIEQGLEFSSHTKEGKTPTAQDIIYHLLTRPTNINLEFLDPKFKGIHTWVPGQYVDSPKTGNRVHRLKFSNLKRGAIRDRLSRQVDVLVVGASPSPVDVSDTRQLTVFDDNGPWTYLYNSLEKNGIGTNRVFFTTASKFGKPATVAKLPQQFITFCKSILQYELMVLNPKVIITLGAEPTKAVTGKTMDKCRGRVEDFFGIPVVSASNPSAFFYNTSGVEQFELDMKTACDIANNQGKIAKIDGINYPSRDYKYTESVDELEAWVKEELDQNTTHFAIDFETATDTGRPEDEYGITFQWSSRPTHARVFCLRGERGKIIHSSNDVVRYKELFRQLFDRDEVVLIGHNLRYDVAFLEIDFDLDLFHRFGNYFDTMEAYHIMQMDKEKGLKYLTIKYTNMGAYDFPMKEWVRQNQGADKLFPPGDAFIHGYRDITYRFLLPYASCDVDSTYRLYLKFKKQLDLPENANVRKVFYSICMPNHMFLREIEKNGMPANEEVMMDLADIYQSKVKELLETLRSSMNWPDFNPNSTAHKNGFLFFGHEFKDSEKIMTEVVPEGAITLGAEPLFTSGVRTLAWKEVDVSQRKDQNPKADSDTLKLLLDADNLKSSPGYPALKALKDFSTIAQFAKTFLSYPKINEALRPSANDTEWLEVLNELDNLEEPDIKAIRAEYNERYAKGTQARKDLKEEAKARELKFSQVKAEVTNIAINKAKAIYEEKRRELELRLEEVKKTAIVYNKGLISCISKEGRISTRINPLSETGRMKHRDPNLANLPKGKEGGIEKVFGHKLPTVRESFIARPGYVILEADYSAAEIWTMAYLGADMDMIKSLHAGVDIHSLNARKFFNVGHDLNDEDFKAQYKYKRAAAKAVIFSIAYGTQAAGLARRLSVEMGEEFPVSEAELAIEGFYRVCAGIGNMLEYTKKFVIKNEYVETAWGRRRYFPGVSKLTREAQAAAQREGPNARIQGTVADCINRAGIYLTKYLKTTKLGQLADCKIINAIHDAILVEVREDYIPFICQLMRFCLADLVTIPCEIPNAKLQIDCEAARAWGKLTGVKEYMGYEIDHKTPFKDWCSQNKDLLPKAKKLIVT